MEQAPTIFAEVICQEEGLPCLHLAEHFNCKADVIDFERQVVRSLALRASLLENSKVVQENLGLLPDHVYDHEDHLLLLVRDLVKVKGGQVQFVVGLEHVFKGWQRVHNVPVVVLTVLVHFHPRCAATHDYF